MPSLIIVQSGVAVGEISRDQIATLFEHLASDRHGDNDLHISRDTLAFLSEAGVDVEIVQLLALALGDRDDVDVTWVDGEVGPMLRGPFR